MRPGDHNVKQRKRLLLLPCGLDRPVREAILRQEGLLGDAPTSTSEASGLALGGSSSIRQRSVVPSEATAATGPRSGSEVFDSAGEEPLESAREAAPS